MTMRLRELTVRYSARTDHDGRPIGVGGEYHRTNQSSGSSLLFPRVTKSFTHANHEEVTSAIAPCGRTIMTCRRARVIPTRSRRRLF